MIQLLRKSKFVYLTIVLVIFSVVNLCIDPPNLYLPFSEIIDKNCDETETITELIIENLLDCYEIFPESESENTEDERLTQKKDLTIPAFIPICVKKHNITFNENLSSKCSLLFNQFEKKPTPPPPWI